MNNSFDDYNFSLEIKQVLNDIDFTMPTSIQKEVIPQLRKMRNVVGVSCTGSGKTHAFLLPIVEGVNLDDNYTQALIIVPTRELAMQIKQKLDDFTKVIPSLKTDIMIGGNELKNTEISKAHIVVGTPGRLNDVLKNRYHLNLTNLKYLVVDEADMVFDNNFIKDVDQVLGSLDNKVCFSIFSATITKNMHPFLKKYFEGVKIIEIQDDFFKNIEYIIVPNKKGDRFDTLTKLMSNINPYLGIIFASKKEDVDDIYDRLVSNGINAIKLHGDLDSRKRAQVLKRINNLEYTYVVASDIASRGIDIDGVSHVISYDMPKEIEYFIHRSGRTGRYKYEGVSYFIYDLEDESSIKKLEKKGIEFKYYDFINDELKEAGFRNRESRVKKSDNYDKNLVGRVYNKKKIKVKPNHKKKRKQQVEKAKKKEAQTKIRLRIKQQRKQRKNLSENSTDNS